VPKTPKYVNRQNDIGEFSPRITAENNARLSIYCKINNFNKTAFLNKILSEYLDTVFNKLKEDNNND